MRASVAPKCGKCQQHPRTRVHAEKCIIPSGRTTELGGVVGRVVASKKTTQTRVTRGRVSEPAPDPKALRDGWVLGCTCLTCNTKYNNWEPEFQDEDAKHGEYDVTKQLPHTSPNYPICPNCLPGHWEAEAGRWGVEKDVKRVYG